MNQIFYHVSIETNEKNNKGENKRFYEWDKTDEKEIINSLIIPYLRGEEFFVDGYIAQKQRITRLLVKETNHKIGVLTKEANNEIPKNILVFLTREDIFEHRTKDVTKSFISRASSIIQKESANITISKDNAVKPTKLSKVFIVHGHDNLAKTEVARFIEKIGLEAIILSEQPNQGKTIIEKMEDYKDVGFAIVLYTPCDEGKSKEESNYKNRARQNVVFEHGFFIGCLGRNHVLALKKDDVELPNDIAGVVYTEMDKNGGWKIRIIQEMRKCGYEIDSNRLF